MKSIFNEGLAFFIGGMNGKETENNNMAQSKCDERARQYERESRLQKSK